MKDEPNTQHLGRAALPQSILEMVGAVTVFGAGVLLGSATRPSPADWMSFLGALIGAGLTVAGSIYVLDRERKREDRESVELLAILLDDVDKECVPFQVANQAALQEHYGLTAKGQVDRLMDAIDRVRRFNDRVKPHSARMMKVEDAIQRLKVDNDIAEHAKLAGIYPKSGDFGGLNAIAHDVKAQIDTIRRALFAR